MSLHLHSCKFCQQPIDCHGLCSLFTCPFSCKATYEFDDKDKLIWISIMIERDDFHIIEVDFDWNMTRIWPTRGSTKHVMIKGVVVDDITPQNALEKAKRLYNLVAFL